MKRSIITLLFVVMATFIGVSVAKADKLPIFDASWNDMTVQTGNNGKPEDYVAPGSDGQVYPGYGGQIFDAEYFFYKITGNTLSIGLQTGFDLINGNQNYNGARYYSGDLFLSFDGSPEVYEYAVDFQTNGGWGTDTGDEQFKNVKSTKNPDQPYASSGPYLVDKGTVIGNVIMDITNGKGQYTDTIPDGISGKQASYWTIVELDLATLLGDDWEADGFTLGAHWTMSCGNDYIRGLATVDPISPPVPEPATVILMGAGLLGMLGMRRRFKK